MRFKCNDAEYEIQEVDNIDLTEHLVGQARYQEKKDIVKEAWKRHNDKNTKT